jgi:DNA mismatch repair protein MutS
MDASSDSPNSETAARLTPMMAQYLEIKAVNPGCLLFYRMGDFYELFFEDAEIASRALGIVLTKRGKHEGEDIRMCGVPVERADDYLNRLIALGHRVAVCEQMEDPAAAKKRGPKSVVKRDVVRLVTPGTITEERLLEPGRARLLVAVQRLRSSEGRQVYGLAALDLSTGAVALSETDETGLAAEIARLEPSEVVASQAVYDERLFSQIVAAMRVPTTPLARDGGDGASKPSTASARSPAPRSPPPLWRSPMSSAPSLRPDPRSRLRPGARAGRVLRSIRRPAPTSSSREP